jgi:hypothetical protein
VLDFAVAGAGEKRQDHIAGVLEVAGEPTRGCSAERAAEPEDGRVLPADARVF